MQPRLTVTQLAERVGVNKSTVSRQVRAWAMVDADGLIDPEAYIARRAELDPALQRRAAPAPRAAVYASAKAMRESHQATLAGLEVQRRLGELIERDIVATTLVPHLVRLRDALLAVPRDHVLDIDEAAACEEAIRDVLTQFSDSLETLVGADPAAVAASLAPASVGSGEPA